MSSSAPQSATSSPLSGQDRGIAAVALLGVCILIALLLVFGFGDDRISPSGGGLVTIQEANDGASRGEAERGLIGSHLGRGQAGRELGRGLRLVPRQVQGETIGYVVGPASTASALRISRLRPGDMLTSIDDRQLNDARAGALADELSTYDRVEIRFERKGHSRKRVLDFTR